MKNSTEIIKKAGIIPDLQLAVKRETGGVDSTGPHAVKMLEDKVIKDNDYETGMEIFMVRYILEEDGTKKKYEVPMKDKNGEIHYLVQRLAEVEEGEEITLECKRRGIKNYIEVKRFNQPEIVKPSADDIPVVEDESTDSDQ